MYTENEHFYIAEEGYCFKPKENNSVMPTMIFKNRIAGYDYIQKPPEPVIEEPTEGINENLTDSERITNLEEQVRDILSKE